jgi:hypothetical protein
MVTVLNYPRLQQLLCFYTFRAESHCIRGPWLIKTIAGKEILADAKNILTAQQLPGILAATIVSLSINLTQAYNK